MTARTAKDSAKGPKVPKAGKRPAKRMGLAGRVAMIAVAAAFMAALAQWVVTPIMAQGEIRFQRQTAVFSGANLLADISRLHLEAGHWHEIDKLIDALTVGMPDGQSAVFDKDWKLMAQDGAGEPLPAKGKLAALAADTSAVLVDGERYYAARPIASNGELYGYAVYSFQPRAFVDIWLWVVLLNAIVLSLVLLIMAPLIYRLARRALKPVTDLERGIRMRDPKDKSKLADSSDDRLLKPLLTAIDEVHERSEAAMRRALTMAYTDPVTRLPNRLRFMSKLDMTVASGGGAEVFLVICDLDKFRQVNVTFGPRVADLALSVVAERLRAAASQTQSSPFFIGRIGADQFGIIFPGGSRESVEAFISAMQDSIADLLVLEEQSLRVTASFGAAASPARCGRWRGPAEAGRSRAEGSQAAIRRADRQEARLLRSASSRSRAGANAA